MPKIKNAEDYAMEYFDRGCWSWDKDNNIVSAGKLYRTDMGVRIVYTKRKGKKVNYNSVGYQNIKITTPEGYRVTAQVHRILWRYYLGPIPAGMTINHKNAQKSDNRLDNLELATMKQQLQHASKMGLLGIKRKYGKDVESLIKMLYKSGEWSQKELAKKYDTTQGTISLIVRGRKPLGVKISFEDAERIRLLYRNGDMTQQELATHYGIDSTYVHLIIAGKRKVSKDNSRDGHKFDEKREIKKLSGSRHKATVKRLEHLMK